MASSSSTLHCQWECRVQMEKVKRRKAADLTGVAASLLVSVKRCSLALPDMSYGSPHLNNVVRLFYLCSWWAASLLFCVSVCIFTYRIYFPSFQHNFSYPSWSMHCYMYISFFVTVSVRVCVCVVLHCTWACYLPATLLGLAVGQNILRALTFSSSPTPPSSLSFSVC